MQIDSVEPLNLAGVTIGRRVATGGIGGWRHASCWRLALKQICSGKSGKPVGQIRDARYKESRDFSSRDSVRTQYACLDLKG